MRRLDPVRWHLAVSHSTVWRHLAKKPPISPLSISVLRPRSAIRIPSSLPSSRNHPHAHVIQPLAASELSGRGRARARGHAQPTPPTPPPPPPCTALHESVDVDWLGEKQMRSTSLVARGRRSLSGGGCANRDQLWRMEAPVIVRGLWCRLPSEGEIEQVSAGKGDSHPRDVTRLSQCSIPQLLLLPASARQRGVAASSFPRLASKFKPFEIDKQLLSDLGDASYLVHEKEGKAAMALPVANPLSRLILSVFVVAASAAAAGDVEFLAARLDPAASAVASPVEEAAGEARSVFTSNGQYFVALNTTVVLVSVVALVGSLVAFLAILSLADKKQEGTF